MVCCYIVQGFVGILCKYRLIFYEIEKAKLHPRLKMLEQIKKSHFEQIPLIVPSISYFKCLNPS